MAGRVVSILELTVAQVASIEEAIGLPVDQWRAASKGKLFPLILAAAEGGTPDDYVDLTLGDLLDRVELGTEEAAKSD